MNHLDFSKLKALSLAPTEGLAFDEWCKQIDVIPFLSDEISDEEILVYVGIDHVFIHAVLVPQDVNIQEHGVDLSNWSLTPYSGWGFVVDQDDVWIEKPCQGTGSKTLKDATQIVFGRYFDGISQGASYFEINQEITHVLGLHYIPERSAWCKLDQHGDVEEVVKIVDIDIEDSTSLGIAVTFNSHELQKYCAAFRKKLLRMFDFTRYKKKDFTGWGEKGEEQTLPQTNGISISLTVEPGVGSYSRGLQIVENTFSPEAIRDELWGAADENDKQYASFIAHDWKNQRLDEICCSPNSLANYFTKSDLPFELSPAFFRPEVLSKYKADRQKYNLQDRSISCRGTWHLETYDINKADQVHTYLVYLSRLPYEEQLHWRQYNEVPKAPLSERAIRTDFKGQWYEEYDPLLSLKRHLRNLLDKKCPWWTLQNPMQIDEVHYPVTTSKDEWANEILSLDQLLVEGLVHKWLKTKVTELGGKPGATIRQLKLFECCLVQLGFEEEHAYELMTPFHEIHNLRSLVKGHRWGTEADNESKKALREFGSYKNHFRSLCQSCEEALQTIISGFEEHENHVGDGDGDNAER